MRHEVFEAPLLMQWHAEHKARQARYAAAGRRGQQVTHLPIQVASPHDGKELRRAEEERALHIYEAARAFTIGVLIGIGRSKPTVKRIQAVVAKHYGIEISGITSERRTSRLTRPRQVAMYIAKQLTQHSLPELGRRFGNRDHTTVIHAVRKITALMATDDAFRAKVDALRAQLEPAAHDA